MVDLEFVRRQNVKLAPHYALFLLAENQNVKPETPFYVYCPRIPSVRAGRIAHSC